MALSMVLKIPIAARPTRMHCIYVTSIKSINYKQVPIRVYKKEKLIT